MIITQTNHHYNFQSNCTFIANTMNITFNGKIHYTTFDTKTSLYFSPDLPLYPTLQTKHYNAPPMLNDTLFKLQLLEPLVKDTLQAASAHKDNLHHLVYEANSAALTSKELHAKLHKNCRWTDTFLSLWRTVPCTPDWNFINPVAWIQHGLSSL